MNLPALKRDENRRPPIGRALLGVVLLWAVVAIPAGVAVPLEGLLAVGLVLLLPLRAGRWFRRLVVLASAVLLFLALADRGTQGAFARPFDPILDLHLLVSGWHLLSGTVGTAAAILFLALALLVFVAALAGLGAGLSALARLPARASRVAGVGLLVLAALGALAQGSPSVASFAASEATLARIAKLAATSRELAGFEEALVLGAALPAGERLLSRLAGKDVLVVFVESYGRSAIEDPRYAPTIAPRLAAIEAEIAQAGFAARSGWLASPTVGGQSWLAHATLLSGLRVDSQLRYDRLMASRRASLNVRFREAGWRTVAVMPAITMEWPEARWYGYDAIYARVDLGYRGAPFNWVTMPDQYTLGALQRLELATKGEAPVMAAMALISSHAPWTPIPPLLPWAEIGDGTVFTPYAAMGDAPEIVWSDPGRIRAQYARAVDYALETLGSFVATYGGDDTVLVVLGDHQPAPVLTGEGASRDVPVHVIARDPAVLAAIADWDFDDGMVPGRDAPVWPMEAFAARFLASFGG